MNWLDSTNVAVPTAVDLRLSKAEADDNHLKYRMYLMYAPLHYLLLFHLSTRASHLCSVQDGHVMHLTPYTSLLIRKPTLNTPQWLHLLLH